MNDACFIVRDKNGQQLGYFYFEEEPGRRTAAGLLTKDEARRLAVNFAKQSEPPGSRRYKTISCDRRCRLALLGRRQPPKSRVPEEADTSFREGHKSDLEFL